MTPKERTFVRDVLAPAIADGFADAGETLVAEIRQEIGTPYPPASKPGTPPHLRTGELRDKMDSQVVSNVSGGRITLTVENTAKHAQYLRDGTGRMAKRDFMQEDKLDEYLPLVVDAVVDSIQTRLK
jgi:hypothetical protein